MIDDRNDWLATLPKGGRVCPTCSQFCKVYRRKFNSGMARSLIWLVVHAKHDLSGWVDVPKTAPRHVVSSREFDKLCLWGLVKAKPNADGKKRTSGLWRATPEGVAFVRSNLAVWSHVFIYNRTVLGFSDDKIMIRAALGKKFEYQELMASG